MTRLLALGVLLLVPLPPALAQAGAPAGERPPVLVRVLEWGAEPAPAAGVEVTARLLGQVPFSRAERALRTATTDARGVARLPAPPAGLAMAVSAALEGGPRSTALWTPSRSGSLRLWVTAGASAVVLVLDGAGQPAPDAEVRLMPLLEPLASFRGGQAEGAERDGVRMARTAADGRARFTGLPRAPLTVEARLPGHRAQLTTCLPRPDLAPLVAIQLVEAGVDEAAEIRWDASMNEGLRRAEATGAPLWIAMAMRGERVNDWMLSHHFVDPVIARAAQDLAGRYNPLFAPATTRAAMEELVTDLLAPGEELIVPRQVLMLPDGRVLTNRYYYLSERDLLRALVRGTRVGAPARARRAALHRLPWVLPALRGHRLRASGGIDEPEFRPDALPAFVALANTGDEHALALLGALPEADVPSGAILAVLKGLDLALVQHPFETLEPFLASPRSAYGLAALALLEALPSERIGAWGVAVLLRQLEAPAAPVRERIEAWLRSGTLPGTPALLRTALERGWEVPASQLERSLRVLEAPWPQLLAETVLRAGRDEAAFSAVLAGLRSRESTPALGVLAACARVRARPAWRGALVPLLGAATRANSALRRELGLRALAHQDPGRAEPVLPRALRDPAPGVRAAAAALTGSDVR